MCVEGDAKHEKKTHLSLLWFLVPPKPPSQPNKNLQNLSKFFPEQNPSHKKPDTIFPEEYFPGVKKYIPSLFQKNHPAGLVGGFNPFEKY